MACSCGQGYASGLGKVMVLGTAILRFRMLKSGTSQRGARLPTGCAMQGWISGKAIVGEKCNQELPWCQRNTFY